MVAVRNQLKALFDAPLAALTGQVAELDLDDALAAARFTLSAANLQPWTFIRVTRPETVQLIADSSLNALGLPMPNHRDKAILQAAELVLVAINVLRAKCRFGERGLEFFAVQDVAAAHSARLAALSRGIASHWIREIGLQRLTDALGLAPRLRLQAVLAFGQADVTTFEQPPRLLPEHFVRSEYDSGETSTEARP